jgi:hypothetical protein
MDATYHGFAVCSKRVTVPSRREAVVWSVGHWDGAVCGEERRGGTRPV